jgi:hypothetical protein
MRNKTLKQRLEQGSILHPRTYHSRLVVDICRVYKKQTVHFKNDVSSDCKVYLEHMKARPKGYSERKWLYPLVSAMVNNNNEIAEKEYQCIVEALSANMENEVVVEVSCKAQHIAMCFDSPHFTSCGKTNGGFQLTADRKSSSRYVFCVFIRDKRGLVQARTFCRIIESTKTLIYYSCYGDSSLYKGLTTLIGKIALDNNLSLKIGNSFV